MLVGLRIKQYSQSVHRLSAFPSGLRQWSGRCRGRYVHGRQKQVFFSWYAQGWDGNKFWQSLRCVHQCFCALVPAHHPTVEVLDHDVAWWLTKFFGKTVAAIIAFCHIFRQGHEVIRMWQQCQVPRSLQNRRNFFAYFRGTEAKARRARSASCVRGEER